MRPRRSTRTSAHVPAAGQSIHASAGGGGHMRNVARSALVSGRRTTGPTTYAHPAPPTRRRRRLSRCARTELRHRCHRHPCPAPTATTAERGESPGGHRRLGASGVRWCPPAGHLPRPAPAADVRRPSGRPTAPQDSTPDGLRGLFCVGASPLGGGDPVEGPERPAEVGRTGKSPLTGYPGNGALRSIPPGQLSSAFL